MHTTHTWKRPLDLPLSGGMLCAPSGVMASADRGPWLLLSRLIGGLPLAGEKHMLLPPLLGPAPCSEPLLSTDACASPEDGAGGGAPLLLCCWLLLPPVLLPAVTPPGSDK